MFNEDDMMVFCGMLAETKAHEEMVIDNTDFIARQEDPDHARYDANNETDEIIENVMRMLSQSKDARKMMKKAIELMDAEV